MRCLTRDAAIPSCAANRMYYWIGTTMNTEPEQEIGSRPMITGPGMRLMFALLGLLLFLLISLLTIGRGLNIQEYIKDLFR